MSELQEDLDPDEMVSYPKPKPAKKTEQTDMEQDKTVEDYDMKQTMDEFDSTINSEISELTSDAYDGWMGADTKWRRSPEGGEDVSVVSQTLDYSNSTAYDDSTSVTSSNVQMELLSSKQSGSNNGSVQSGSEETQTSSSYKKDALRKKDREKVIQSHSGVFIYLLTEVSLQTERKKKKKKDKERQQKDSRRGERKRASRDELEEFLNGSPSSPIDAAYEAI